MLMEKVEWGFFRRQIYTRRRDGNLGGCFRLVDFGADPAILEEGWAHLGTEKIKKLPKFSL